MKNIKSICNLCALSLLMSSVILSGCTESVLNVLDDIGVVSQKESETTVETEGETESNTDTEANIESQPNKMQEIIRDNNCKVAVAFIGYISYDSTTDDITEYVKSNLNPEYSYLLDEKNTLMDFGGEQVYLIVPAQDYAMSVTSVEISDEGELVSTAEAPKVTEANDVLILRCNVSEVYPDVLIALTDGSDTYEYRPYISLMDGHLNVYEGCYDFSSYGDSLFNEDEINAAMQLLSENDEVKYYLDLGMVIRYTNSEQIIDGKSCVLFVLGTDSEDRFVQEKYYAVYAINAQQIYEYDPVNDIWSALAMG